MTAAKSHIHITSGRALDVLAAAYAAGRKVRFWLDVGNSITGVFQAKSGATVAVATASCAWLPDTKDTSRVYYGMNVGDNWANPCKVATREAMLQYQAEEIAARAADAEAENEQEYGVHNHA